MCAELTKTVALTSSTISRALCSVLGEKTRPRGRRKDGIGRIPCDHLQHLEFMFSGGVTAPAAQPKALQGDVEDPGSFRGHQPGTRTGYRRCQTPPKVWGSFKMQQSPGRTNPPRSVPGSRDGAEALCKAWTALESPCWHRKQLSGESRSHLHFKVTQDWS